MVLPLGIGWAYPSDTVTCSYLHTYKNANTYVCEI